MGGMGGGGLSINDPTVVSAFHHALLTGGFVVLGLLPPFFLVWRLCRTAMLRRMSTGGSLEAPGQPAEPGLLGAPASAAEPVGRRLIRIGFGLLWRPDGVLQGQASMPLGMISKVVQPAADSSPRWVQHVVGWVT